MNLKNILSTAAALSLCLSLFSTSALALEYTYEGDAPGDVFHQSTSTDYNYIADNGQIVVGTDGTVSAGETGDNNGAPASPVEQLPVGEYPEAYGLQTDVDIAGNTVFPNELGPTTQNSAYYKPTFIPTVDSGALPTGNTYIPTMPTTYSPAGYYSGNVLLPTYTSYTPLQSYGMVTWNTTLGTYQYTSTSSSPMPTITSGGAIGRLSIPSIGLNKYVYEGTSQASMKKGIAHFPSTSGWLGNVALAGHNRGSAAYFGKLKNVKVGDTVSYTTAYGTAVYRVTQIKTVKTTDTSGLLQDGTNKLTMYTCKANQPNVKLCVIAQRVG